VAIGGSIQIGSLTSALRSKFRDHPHSHEVSDTPLHHLSPACDEYAAIHDTDDV
jgi:hypothetical protein